ncbi:MULTISPECIES: YeaH/YhbH family protein [Pseudoalteromonas]|uniref:YeaH/YhbH family protein n=1 Tax=Pseudoalteromonas TaxID=53246 RepID=UPI001572F499|nr:MULTISPECIES: YeaH/YhbH family protein [Pseudoalteromonas]MBR8842741.1 YeaH/YhbH family protein [Pseudoalteromonas sp. JC3]NSY32235.1 YeaH/YhbH family protein [Pseudoalteromonas sp. JC28]UDM62111.1 YeaH/YhbH family protein [Pseudoalteromonas piscicida]WJE10213.1 YeaH/YhbH family protein [Pseudoalteromonas sp. JC3]
MAHFIDRRLNGKNKSTLNRQRFIRRYKKQIKKAVSEAINKRSVTDISSGESISIPQRDISEPTFHQGKGGDRELIHPGNDQFSTGDRIQRPPSGQGGGSGDGEASNQGEGQDDFVFSISKDEYLDLLFEDLELPNLQQSQLDKLMQLKTHRAGFCNDGMPSNLDIVRSLKGSMARRIAMTSSKRRELRELEEELASMLAEPVPPQQKINDIELRIQVLKEQIAAVPFIDNYDLRFRNYERRPHPTSKAVMFCLMDVSGSMDQATKDMAKRFYILLYQFLTRTYKDIEVVYIRHHTQAKEVDEQEFFYSQETGGTIVSSALKLMDEIIQERYAQGDWNIYAAQASDGDNWADDSPQCTQILSNKLLKIVRYYAYIEITTRAHQSLWREYQGVANSFDNFAMQHIRGVEDIYPIFRELFKKNKNKQSAA